MKKIIIAFLLCICMAAGSVMAATKEEATINVDEARLALQKLMNSPDASVPQGLMRQARAVLIVPSLLKGGFIVGASYGNGVALIRQADGHMGPPLFFNVGGASLGLQIGGQSSDLVLVIASQRGLEGLLKNEMTLGSDLSVAAGPLGRTGRVAVSGASTDADIYSYSSTAGLFAGVSLDGTGISYDQQTTSTYYGHANVGIKRVYEQIEVPSSGRQLMDTLDKYMVK